MDWANRVIINIKEEIQKTNLQSEKQFVVGIIIRWGTDCLIERTTEFVIE